VLYAQLLSRSRGEYLVGESSGLCNGHGEVSAGGDFEGVGLAARNVGYQARVVSSASDADVARLLRETDAVAEIHNRVLNDRCLRAAGARKQWAPTPLSERFSGGAQAAR
jgi:hypothetical protein